MNTVLKIAASLLLIAAIASLIPVIKEWNYSFDQHGFYTDTNGILHRESQTEQKQFLLVLSALLFFVTAFFGFKKPVALTQSK